MKRVSTLMMVTAAVLLQTMFCVWAQAAQYGDVTVTEQAIPRPERHVHGYVEYRFTLFNDSADKPRTVRLVVPGNSWGVSGNVSRSVTLLPKTQGLVSMWQPPVSVSGQGARVYIDGRLQEEVTDVAITPTYTQNMTGLYAQNVLFSQGVDSHFRDNLGVLKSKALSSGSSWSSGSKDEFGERTTVPVSQWSESWLGYTSFDGLVMTSNEWRTLPARVRDAICSWVDAGGSLLVVGKLDVPARWIGRVDAWRSSSQSRVKTARVNFGIIAVVELNGLTDWSETEFTSAYNDLWNNSAAAGAAPMAISDANTTFPVTDSLGVPARGMLAIMLLFAILIGPVNMIVFARLNKRLWTLVTIPAAAILFSACVFAYTMLADGVSAVGRAQSLTILDQKNHHATTIGWLGYYAPLQPSDGLHFDLDTELSPQIGGVSHGYRDTDANARFTDWSTDQHLTTGWISSRIPTHFTLRKSQSRRERLQVTQNAQGEVTVVNGLGSDILTLHLVDGERNLFIANGPIPAGQQVKLSRTSIRPTGFEDMKVSTNWRSNPADLEIDGSTNNTPNTYVASLVNDVFIEKGLTRLKSFKTQSRVYGLFEMNSKEGD